MRPCCPKSSCRHVLMTAVLATVVTGCTTYHPVPLATHVDLAANIDQLAPRETTKRIGSAKSLRLTDVAILAVWNNPKLKAQRKRLGVAQAQLFAAGLLPDPQLSLSVDHPTGSATGTVDAYSFGLDYTVLPLITRGARLESGRQAERQVALEIRWQQWQVAQRARMLAVRLVSRRRQLGLLRKTADLYRSRYEHARKALAHGDLTVDIAGTDLTSLLDILSQMRQMEQQCSGTSHDLHLLLGLLPDAPLPIRLPSPPTWPDAVLLRRQLRGVENRRPDLLGLRAGYQSQEAKVRAAVLAQFPSLTLGINRARDTGDIATAGFGISLNLPLFSGGKGRIAVERATREQLRREYQARLDRTAVEVDKLLDLHRIIAAQIHQLEAYLPALKAMVVKGRKAYRRRDIDALTFLHMESTWIQKRQEMIRLEETRRENFIALQTLLALPGQGGVRRFPQAEKGVEYDAAKTVDDSHGPHSGSAHRSDDPSG